MKLYNARSEDSWAPRRPYVTTADELADDVDEYAAYIRQITGDGEAIVDCLIRIMEDDSVGAKPYERLDAQLLLDSHRLRKTRRRSGLDHPAGRRRARAAAHARRARLAEGRERRDAQASRHHPLRRDPLSPPDPRQAEDRQGQEDGRLPHRRRQGRDERLQDPTTGSGPQSTSPHGPTPGRPTPSVPDSPSRTP